MKAAACFIGRITTWEHNLRAIMEIIGKTFDCPVDYFASVHGDPSDEYIQKFIDTLKPVSANIEKVARVPRNEVWKERMYSALFHKWKVVQLVEAHGTYDWVFIFRADLTNVNVIKLPDALPLEKTVYVPTPQPGNNHYIGGRTPDHIDGGSMETMKAFSAMFTEIEKYINDIPENGLYQYLCSKNLTMKEFYWGGEVDPRRGGWGSQNYE